MLYDKKFIDKLPATRQFENPWLVGICKFEHNKKLRSLIERWFLHIPVEHRSKLETRLKSLQDADFIPAFYELMIHQFCVEEGWSVEYEPTIMQGKTPDLRVTTQSGSQFILDATTVFDTDDFRRSVAKKIELTHAISTIETSNVLDITYRSFPEPNAKPSVMVRRIRDWLSSLPEGSKTHSNTFNAGGYELTVDAGRRKPKPKGGAILSVTEPSMSVPDYSKRIRSVIDDKRRKYSSRDTGLPLVVMFGDALGLVRSDENAIDKALFGQHIITFDPQGGGQSQMGRDRSGYFTPSNNSEGAWQGKNTGVSAVMYASLKEQGSFQMQLFHNPLPFHTLDSQIFYKIPQLINFGSGTNITMRWVISNPSEHRVYFS